MDGLQARLSRSIQLQLSFWLSLAILLIGLAAGAYSAWSAFDEAHELQDDMLRQVAAMFRQHRLPVPFNPDAAEAAQPMASDEAPQLRVQWMQPLPAAPGGTALPQPPSLGDGLHTLVLQGDAHRVFVSTLADGRRLAVSQRASLRDDAARESAQRTALPFALLLPVLLLVLRGLVRRLFRPVAALASEIDQRSERDLRALDEAHLVDEVRPFATAINRLLGRVQRAMAEQQRFVADAAHELRSPLTALALQAERLAQAELSDTARVRLDPLRDGIRRSQHLLEQLLTLARAQAPGAATSATTSAVAASTPSVLRVYRGLLEDRMLLAEAKGLDIGVVGEADAALPVHEADLRMLLGNLLDNAIRYTPDGGRVDLVLGIEDTDVLLQVRDDGPGIPEADRQRVFDPFYRLLGSGQQGTGLGLAIVKAVAERWGARVALDWSDAQARRGLCASVRLRGAAP